MISSYLWPDFGMIKKASWFCLLVLSTTFLGAQVRTIESIDTSQSDTSDISLIYIDFADTTQTIRHEDGTETLILLGNVALHQDSLFMYCDSTRKVDNNLRARGNVILQHWDSVYVFADSLDYLGNDREATLTGEVVLENGPQRLYTDSLKYNTGTKVARYSSRAWITNDTTTLTSLRGTYYVDADQMYFRDSVYIKSTDFELYADSLRYESELDLVTFESRTVIHLSDSGQIYCEAGTFDIQNQRGVFTSNAQYQKDARQAEGDTIFYDAELGRVRIVGDGQLTEEKTLVKGDELIYLIDDERLEVYGNGYARDSTREINAENLVYDVKNDQFSSDTRTVIDDGPQHMEADALDYDSYTGIGVATGNVIWSDTSADYTIFTERANYSDSSGYFKAYEGRPVLLTILDGDSLFMSADTLVSFEGKTDADTFRMFQAYHNVKIFKEDLQATCDSLTYSSQDSVFNLYQNPLMWSDSSQFSADSMQIYLSNSEIDYVLLKKDAFIINTPDEVLYNQMQGKDIRANFNDGELATMRIEGNAQSVYYALDDSGAYIGVNKTLCSSMLIKFGNNEVSDITFYSSPKATFYPIQKTKPGELRLEGFAWRYSERPKDRKEIRTPTTL